MVVVVAVATIAILVIRQRNPIIVIGTMIVMARVIVRIVITIVIVILRGHDGNTSIQILIACSFL